MTEMSACRSESLDFFSVAIFVRVLRTKKLKTYLLRTQNSRVLPLKPGAGQNTAMYASPDAWDVFFEQIFTLQVHSPAFCTKYFSDFFLAMVGEPAELDD